MTFDGEDVPEALQAKASGQDGPGGDAVVTIGPDGCVTGWNTGAEALLGWTQAEALGRDAAFFRTTQDQNEGAFAQACERVASEGRVGYRHWHHHRNGSLVWVEGHFGPEGPGLPGFMLVMHGEAGRQAEIRVLQETVVHFRTLVEGIPQLVWRSCDRGQWTWASPQWLAYTGQTQAETHGLGWVGAVHVEDRPAVLRAWEKARTHGQVLAEFRLLRASDGAWRWHQTRSMPVRGAPEPGWPEGRILEWLGTTTDIEDFKQLQNQQSLLVAELQHRTRNLLAVVSAIARRNFGGTEGSAEFQLRLATLGRVQGFLSRAESWSLDLKELVFAELRAAGDGQSRKAHVEGPVIELPGEKAQPVALALHELATNAAKYGALAQNGAGLSVTWRLEGDSGDERQLVLFWCESGVVMQMDAPRRRGYGTELIERALPYQLKAKTELVFTPDGARCTLLLPLGPAIPPREGRR